MFIYLYIFIFCMAPPHPPPPHERPSPLKHRPHRRLRAFPEVSSFSLDFVCPEPHPSQNQKTKVSRKMRGQFLFLDSWIFGFLDCYVKTKNPKIQKSKNPTIQKTNNPQNQNCPRILRETLVFGFWEHPCASHTSGLCLYTNNTTITEVKLNTGTPMNTRNS